MVKVKKSDKGDFYKRQQTWELRDLTEVDAKDASKVKTTDASFYFFTYNLTVAVNAHISSHGLGKSRVRPSLREGVPLAGQQHG